MSELETTSLHYIRPFSSGESVGRFTACGRLLDLCKWLTVKSHWVTCKECADTFPPDPLPLPRTSKRRGKFPGSGKWAPAVLQALECEDSTLPQIYGRVQAFIIRTSAFSLGRTWRNSVRRTLQVLTKRGEVKSSGLGVYRLAARS